MADELARGTPEYCLSRGPRAACLLKRFEAVVSDEEMELVRDWFEELHLEADQYLRSGYELVSVGFDNRQEWNAGPFMVFNPTRWEGPKRKLLAPTAEANPRRWVTIRIHSLTKPVRVFQAPARAFGPEPLVKPARSATPGPSARARVGRQALQPALHD